MAAREEPNRPEPEALLAEAAREGSGRLKIYLGMAPGVGKTYAMLEGAKRLLAQGVDVVAGLIEPHGRRETEALAAGFAMLPPRRLHYKGHLLDEFDLDAALARRPALLLLDELAHSNAPGSRHAKRWQDVAELLRAGIDVHTTLNVQHLESLGDVVAQITGVRVQETLPDRVLEEADEVELIDLPPEELVQRLEAGKVYVPQLAGRARENFFRLGNLAALRELALRRTAERVDAQMRDYMRAHAIAGPWPASERVLVCVGAGDDAPAVIRAGRRIAEQARAPWIAAHVERPGEDAGADAVPDEVLLLAERLGARVERLTGPDLPGEILRYARRDNVTRIVIGRSRSSWLREALRRSLALELVRRSGGIEVLVVTPPAAAKAKRRRRRIPAPSLAGLATAAASVAGVVLAASLIPGLRGLPNVSLLFLIAVVLTAAWHGRGAALLAAVLSFLAGNFFFAEPRFTFEIARGHDILTLIVFLIVAGITGSLAGRPREQAVIMRARLAALHSLYDFSRRLGKAKTSGELLHAVVLRAQRLLERPAMMLLPEGEDLAIRYAWPPADELDEASWAAARWAFRHAEPAGAGTNTLPSALWHFRPMRIAKGALGVFGLRVEEPLEGSDFLQTLDAMLDQAAVAIERIAFAENAAAAAAAAETERFRNALLTSVSHDLRTPLTSILGSATALRRDPARYDEAARDELLATIEEETERLDRFVVNLLDLARLEAGALDVRRDWLVLAEVVDSALRRSRASLARLEVRRLVAADLPLLRADYTLLETILANLFDNAGKHALDARVLSITARAEAGSLRLAVEDDGEGIPADQLPHVFDKFYRLRRSDRVVAGTGIGLAICKGMVEALGGDIAAASPVRDGRGTRFDIVFPLEAQPTLPPEAQPTLPPGEAP